MFGQTRALMKKLNTFLETRAGDIALGLGTVGILAHLTIYLMSYSKIVGPFIIVYFQDPLRRFLNLQGGYDVNISFLSLLFLFMLAVGGYHYKKSGGIDDRLMKFGFSLLAVTKLLQLISAVPNHLSYQAFAAANPSRVEGTVSTFGLILSLVIALVLFYVGFHIARWLVRRQEEEYVLEGIAETGQTTDHHPVPKIKRFVHLIVDLFLMFVIVWPAFRSLVGYLMNGTMFFQSPRLLSSDLVSNLLVASMAIIYYLTFEGLFHATPVKFLTETRVVDAKTMAPPAFGTVFARTLCRRIPFNALSFLGNKGWHDSFSGTELLLEKKKGQVRFGHWIWLLALVGGYVAIIAYSYISEYIDDTRTSNLYDTAAAYRTESTLANLNNGDLLLLRKKGGDGRDDQLVVMVDKVTGEEVTGNQYQIIRDNRTNRYNRPNRSKFLENGVGQNWKMLDQVSISMNQIAEAFRKKGSRLPVTLNNESYLLESIEDIDNPVFNNGGSSSQTTNGLRTSSYSVSYDARRVEIVSLKLLEGKIEWDIPTTTTRFDVGRATGSFQLTAKESGNRYSKSRLRVQYDGREHDYLIFKYGSTVRIIKEVSE